MMLTISLTPELESRLKLEAERRGLSAQEYTIDLLDRHLPQKDHPAELVALLQAWMDEGDAQEQRETGEILVHSLDQDRL